MMSDNKENLCGVGGWLAFLIFQMMVLFPVFSILFTYTFIDYQESLYPAITGYANWASFKNITWIIVLLAALIRAFAGYALWNVHESTSVKLAKWALWISGPGSSVLFMILAYKMFEAVEAMVIPLIGNIVAATVFTVYLTKSKRVQNTYYTVMQMPTDIQNDSSYKYLSQPDLNNATQPSSAGITSSSSYEPIETRLESDGESSSVGLTQNESNSPNKGPHKRHNTHEAPMNANEINAVVPESFFPDLEEVDEEKVYEQVANELERGNVRKGLWIKLWAESEGDDRKTRLEYIKVRVAEITAEQLEQLQAQHLARDIAAQKARQEAKESQENELKIESVMALHGYSHQEAEAYLDYGIVRDGTQYIYSGYRYDRLQDAVEYAKLKLI